jgi:hypothetical protein
MHILKAFSNEKVNQQKKGGRIGETISDTYLIEGAGKIVIYHIMHVVNVDSSRRYISRKKNRSFAYRDYFLRSEDCR